MAQQDQRELLGQVPPFPAAPSHLSFLKFAPCFITAPARLQKMLRSSNRLNVLKLAHLFAQRLRLSALRFLGLLFGLDLPILRDLQGPPRLFLVLLSFLSQIARIDCFPL